MTRKLGVVMDPIGNIQYEKDSTLALLVEAQKRGFELRYMEMSDLYARDGEARARMQPMTVRYDANNWFDVEEAIDGALSELDVILMRKDPPFDTEYIYSTYLLELAERCGVLVVNRPAALRDVNEKMSILEFPQCTPVTMVSRDMARLRSFIEEHGDSILKPLGGMGGAGIYRVRHDDPNIGVILETLSGHGTRFVMAQQFVAAISAGDKRIFLVDGKPLPYGLARIPKKGETRGNLAAGGTGKAIEINDRDRWICEQVGESLRARGLLFVGLDVIGDYLTEINVTSPTCIREVDKAFDENLSRYVFDAIEAALQ